jgi:hypothetical protein
MPDALDVLGTDYREVKQILSELESGPALGGGATEAQLRARSPAMPSARRARPRPAIAATDKARDSLTGRADN